MSDAVVPDLNAFVLTSRVKDVGQVFGDAADAERLGFKRLFVAERYDLREAGALLGGVAARTSRLEIGTGAVIPASRPPIMTAALGATMQALYGSRFNLGLGRGIASHLRGQGLPVFGWDEYADYVSIVRRLWAGETVAYDGPLGTFESLRMAETLDGPPPLIWTMIVGGPVASRRAACIADAVMLSPFLTPHAVHDAVTTIRKTREEHDLDPAITICQPVVTAPDLDEVTTLEVTRARLVGYLFMPELGRTYARLNGWDPDTIRQVLNHEQLASMARPNVDQSFRLHQLHEVARRLPQEWVRQAAAVGSVGECVNALQAYRDAGADELAIYGTSPAQNAALIDAWRARSAAYDSPGGE
ncbi:MAG TPA: TIGR03857 family LLM class F420-dependent oxidoreductase [Acidimicrobiia bacterium]